MKGVDGRHCRRNRGALYVHVALKGGAKVSALQETDKLSRSALAYLSGVLVHVNVNDASMFVALLDDVVLDLGGPAGIILSGNEMGGGGGVNETRGL